MERFSWQLTVLYCRGTITRLCCGTVTGDSGRRAWSCGTGVRGQPPQPASFRVLAVCTEGGEQWGLGRSLYSGRRAAFSARILLEGHPGWCVFRDAMPPATSWAGRIRDFPCAFYSSPVSLKMLLAGMGNRYFVQGWTLHAPHRPKTKHGSDAT